MSVVSTGDFAKAVAPQVPKWYGVGYERFPELYRQIFKVEMMDSAIDEDVLISTMGLMVQTTEGESTPYDRMRQVFVSRYMPADFRLGLIITQNMIDDGKAVKILEQRAKALGIAHKETMDILAHNVINRAQTSGYNGADGVTLINSAHPTSSGVSFSNIPSTVADLSEAALEQAHIDLGNITDDRGLKLKVYPRKLVVPRALTFEAQRLLGSELRPSSSDNDLNAIKNLQLFPEGVLVDDYITNATAWYIITSENENGLKFKIRKEMKMGEDVHFDTDNVKFKGHTRVVPGWTDPRCIYGCVGP